MSLLKKHEKSCLEELVTFVCVCVWGGGGGWMVGEGVVVRDFVLVEMFRVCFVCFLFVCVVCV